ncbi:MAG: hypothetical protein IKL10_02935 [Clostridia bacterium]|nr:hypothetical protein [Clostridia bacterium]
MKNKKIIFFIALPIVILFVVCIFGLSQSSDTENTTLPEDTVASENEKPVNGVIKGTDGWLYYASTLGDYTGSGNASDRKIYNTAHNIALMQEFCESLGVSFVFTAAPNKNSVYYENMPSFYKRNTENNNIARLIPLLKNENVNFVDLFTLFSESEEPLYLKTDSHWNNKGALIAFGAILEALKKDYEPYEDGSFVYEARECGDLEKALEKDTPAFEENYYYTEELGFTYKTKTESVEEPLILTGNPAASGRLVMFRDSFGNSLLPFMADNFSSACFSKGVPYMLEKFIQVYSADHVIVEVAERNVTDYAVAPPVFSGLEKELSPDIAEKDGISATVNIKASENAMDYLKIYGAINGDEAFTEVFVEINGKCYEAFTVSDTEGDYSYLLYLPKDRLSGIDADVKIYISANGMAVKAAEQLVSLEDF